MIKKVGIILLIFITVIHSQTQAQDYYITFGIDGENDVPESIKIENLVQDTELVLTGNDVLHLFGISSGITKPISIERNLSIFPNPTSTSSTLTFYNPIEGNVVVKVFNIAGKLILYQSDNLPQSEVKYTLGGLNIGCYIVNIHTNYNVYSTQIISTNSMLSQPYIKLQSALTKEIVMLKSDLKSTLNDGDTIQMSYNNSELLLFTANSDTGKSRVTLVPESNKTVYFDFSSSSLRDIDGNVYSTVEIGDQVWMTENMKVTHYADGSEIPLIENDSEWDKLSATAKAYCWYNNDRTNIEDYGALYTWAAVMNGVSSISNLSDKAQGVCPSGWHLPSDHDWKVLEMHLGMPNNELNLDFGRGTDEGGKLKEKGTIHWNSPNTGATNETGFTALAGGLRFNNGQFGSMGRNAEFWTATEYPIDDTEAWDRYLAWDYPGIGRYQRHKKDGLSVRCIKD